MGIIKFLDTRLFAHAEESEQDFEKVKQVEDKATFSISHLFGFDYLRQQWTKLLTDTDGRLIVSSGATKTSDMNMSQIEVTNSVTLVASINNNRKEIWIQNISDHDLQLLMNDVDNNTDGLTIPSQGIMIIDVYVGNIYMIDYASSGDVIVSDFF